MSGFLRNIFGGQPASNPDPVANAQPPAGSIFSQGPTQGGAQPPGQMPSGAASNPTVPGNTALPNGSPAAIPAVDANKSTLDTYMDLWQAPAQDDKSKAGPQAPAFTLDMAKLNETVNTMDFMQTVPQEVLTKAMQGDAAAMQAALNHAARGSFSMSTAMTTKMMEKAVADQTAYLTQTVFPEMMRTHSTKTAMQDQAWANNPVMQPMADAMRAQLQMKFPTASPAAITEHLNNVMKGISEQYLQATGYDVTKRSSNGSLSDGSPAGGSTDFADWVRTNT